MTLSQAAQNVVIWGAPVLVYAAVARWRYKLAWSEIAGRLGLRAGRGRTWLIALVVAVVGVGISMRIASTTAHLINEYSPLKPFLDAQVSPSLVLAAFWYGGLATGFAEELLFRGLIAGALFRRLRFWTANLIQAGIFMLPHLLILIVAPSLWPLAIVLPLGMGLALGWLRVDSGSIGPAWLVHAAGNMAGALAITRW